MKYLSLNNISFHYPNEENDVIKDLSLELNKGECLAVSGDNGSGKTTLLKILNGLCFPDQGNYYFEDIQITESYLNQNSQSFHHKIGFVFQNPDVMLFNRSVYDEIAYGPRQLGLSRAEVETRVNDCMELFGISNLKEKAPYHLSGGQKKKVSFAAVLSLNPEVITLDEPCAFLDQKSRIEIIELLVSLKEAGKTLIISTHDSELVEKLADKTIIL